MKTKSLKGKCRFQLKILAYGNSYCIERVARLEAALAKKPRRFQLDLVGEGEITADTALLICSILRNRSPKTQLVTNAQSSLQGGSVLVWLAGDRRLIREDARVFFRRSEISEDDEAAAGKTWKPAKSAWSDSASETDPDEADYDRLLQVINEFLPVKELAGRPVYVPELRRFGLVENEQLDRFLATAFGKAQEGNDDPPGESKDKRVRAKPKTMRTGASNK